VLYILYFYLLLLNFTFVVVPDFTFPLENSFLIYFLFYCFFLQSFCTGFHCVNALIVCRRTTGPVRRVKDGWTEKEVSLSDVCSVPKAFCFSFLIYLCLLLRNWLPGEFRLLDLMTVNLRVHLQKC